MSLYKENSLWKSQIWHSASFLRVWIAQGVSQIGDQIYLLALPLLVYKITGSGSQMSIVFGFEMLPYILFSVLGGTLSDNWNRKLCLVLGNVFASIPLVFISILYIEGHLRMTEIYIASVILSSIVAMILPSFEACIPDFVNEKSIIHANSLTELTSSTTIILGPMISGLLITQLGPNTAILIDVGSFLLSGIIFTTVKFKPFEPSDKKGFKQNISFLWDGVTYVPKHKILRWGMFMSTMSNIILGAYDSVLIFHMKHRLHLSAQEIGIVLAIASVMSLMASGVIAPLLNQKNKGTVMIWGLFLQGVGVTLVGLAGNVILLILAQSIYTGSLTLYTINWRSLRQIATPKNMIGRVSGVSRGVAYVGASAGGFLGGVLLLHVTSKYVFIVDGLATVIVSLITMLGPLRTSERIVSDPFSLGTD